MPYFLMRILFEFEDNKKSISRNFMKKLIHCIKSMTFRKRGKDEINRKFNFKLKSHDNWDDTFDYPYLCEIIEVLLPKISVSYFYLNKQTLRTCRISVR